MLNLTLRVMLPVFPFAARPTLQLAPQVMVTARSGKLLLSRMRYDVDACI